MKDPRFRTPAQRLRFARENAGYRTQKDFLRHHPDISQPTLSQHESGRRGLKREVAEEYADALGCSAAWLLTGEGEPPGDPREGIVEPGVKIMEFDVRLAHFPDGVAVGFGEPGNESDVWEMPKVFLTAQTTADAKSLKVIRVYGDSMEPLFRPGDRVLVDTSDTKPTPPGIFVVWDGLGVTLKRLEFVPYSAPPKVRLLAANTAYGAHELPLSDVQIGGRVIGKWNWT